EPSCIVEARVHTWALPGARAHTSALPGTLVHSRGPRAHLNSYKRSREHSGLPASRDCAAFRLSVP
ncbi:hypothetical protein NDU88_000797, partial [Pleurodeles waltl]